jgi:hypothetical protein
MTAVDASTALDVASLTREFRSTLLPAVGTFLANKSSANELRQAWRPYYYDVFHPFDRAVEQAWRRVAGSDGSVESGPPQADPAHELPLRLFPVSVAHNNLDRLVEVLAVELGDRTASDGSVPERIVDLAHVVDALHQLMTSLAARP